MCNGKLMLPNEEKNHHIFLTSTHTADIKNDKTISTLFVPNILLLALINSRHFNVYNIFKLKKCKMRLLTLA